MTTTATGHAAEQVAARHLAQAGYQLLGRNWRNRWCELDLIARHLGVVHIIEVKYRANPAFGLPAEYVRADKLQRLSRAALAWCQAHGYHGPYQIDVISVCGQLSQPQVEHLIDITGMT